MRIKFAVMSILALMSLGALDTSRMSNAAADKTELARGRYIVESVGVCSDCHTPHDATGELDRSRWLLGGPVVFESALPAVVFADVAPRLAGLPPGTDEQFIRLLMTGISRTGEPLRPPMPQFRLTRADAVSVLAYLKSLKSAE